MAVSDPIADMLTKIRNASQAKHEKVDVSASNLKLQIVKILKNEGFIKNFKKVTKDDVNYSTPGRRVYCGYKDMPSVYNGIGVVVVSSSTGVITGKKAKEARVGGELICTIW